MLKLQQYKMYYIKYILLIIYILNLSGAEKSFEETICKSATIRSIQEFNQLQNCTLVTGFVRLVQMDFSPVAYGEIKPSKIHEINEYLLVYRVQGLDSLERLFPMLTFIRGTELLFDNYALAIMENRDLENIGLVSLLRVLKGALRIESNPLLCYVHTIDWIEILGFDVRRTDIHITNNKSPNYCPLCVPDDSTTEDRYPNAGCWSSEKFQMTLDQIRGKECFNSSCLTSCDDDSCENCLNYFSDKGCTSFCQPHNYKLAFKRECVADCAKYGMLEHGLNCVEDCPKHYDILNNAGTISCVLNCTGNLVIHNIKDLESLADCTTINGSLTIEIHETEKPIVQYLEDAFRNIIEITGYLKVVNSPQITTLHFFKNLHTIRGSQLIENRYALYVVDNNYLEELFLGNVVIFKGCVYFHLNPLLCHDKIIDLQKNFRECKKITIVDVSEYSNGERAVCGQDIILSNTTVVDFNSTAALIEVDILSSSELVLLFGYVYFYKEAPFRNVTKYDGRHGCGTDSWFTDIVLTKRRRHIIKHLKPATQYAYFVNSLTVMYYPYLAEHVSEIRYFRTSPAKPSAVSKLFAITRSGTKLDLHWWPPLFPNGIIERYILHYEIINDTEGQEISELNILNAEVCQCPKHHTESQISTPNVHEFYNSEQLEFRDTILNFLFPKKKKKTNTKDKRSTTESDFESDADYDYNMLMEKLQETAINTQEEKKESYVIEHPKPICEHLDADAKEAKNMTCEPLEIFQNIVEIPGFRHSTTITDLEPEKTYRFSISACVKNLVNGCGPEKVIQVATMSKKLASLLANISF